MALTQQELQALKGKGFGELYKKHKVQWKKRAKTAYQYVSQNWPTGAAARIDDVAEVLTPILTVDDDIRKFLQQKKAHQKYWVRYCCDYILDQVWLEISSA